MAQSVDSPFVSCSVQPMYGHHRARLLWQIAPEWRMAVAHVYKSETGFSPWQRLNQNAELRAFAGEFLDEDFRTLDQLLVTHYRILLIHPDGRRNESPVIGIMDLLSRREYGHVRKILVKEEARLRKCDGVPVFHFVPLAAGDPNPRVRQDTGQALSAECPGDDPESFGMPFLGGFAPPVQTWVQMRTPVKIQQTTAQDGMSRDESLTWSARVLPYPRPSVGHVYVNPVTDARYVVAGEPNGHYFRGIVPVGYDVNLILLGRDDPRYRLPVPTMVLKRAGL